MTTLGPLGCLKTRLKVCFGSHSPPQKNVHFVPFRFSTFQRLVQGAQLQPLARQYQNCWPLRHQPLKKRGLANPAHPGRALEDMYVSVCLCFKGFLFGKLCKVTSDKEGFKSAVSTGYTSLDRQNITRLWEAFFQRSIQVEGFRRIPVFQVSRTS